MLAALLGIGAAAIPGPGGLWYAIAKPEVDGGWRFVEINGVDVRKDGYSLGIRWGEITGFHDGCNGCGFDDELPSGSPNRSMMCTLVACEEKPHDRLFWPFAHGDPAMEVAGDRLILRLDGSRAMLERAGER